MKACMGGFCRIRESCGHYNAYNRQYPAERLCVPERDGIRKSQALPFKVNVHVIPLREQGGGA
jgi:hypothetical protein